MTVSKKQIVISVIAFIVIAYLVWRIFFRSKPITDADAVNELKSITSPGAASNLVNQPFPLIVGSKGEKVKILQGAINKKLPQANLTLDGNFGVQTKSMLYVAFGTNFYPVTTNNYIAILKQITPTT